MVKNQNPNSSSDSKTKGSPAKPNADAESSVPPSSNEAVKSTNSEQQKEISSAPGTNKKPNYPIAVFARNNPYITETELHKLHSTIIPVYDKDYSEAKEKQYSVGVGEKAKDAKKSNEPGPPGNKSNKPKGANEKDSSASGPSSVKPGKGKTDNPNPESESEEEE